MFLECVCGGVFGRSLLLGFLFGDDLGWNYKGVGLKSSIDHLN